MQMHRGIIVAKRKKKCQMDFADLFDFAGNILSIVLSSLFFFPVFVSSSVLSSSPTIHAS